MSIGQMTERVAIQENTVGRTKGVKSDSYATIETVYARVRPLSQREKVMASQKGMIASHEFLMRYRDDIGTGDTEVLPKYRLLWDSRTFDIRGVLNTEFRNRHTVVIAEERR